MFETLTASDWAGWVGAITGSFALTWEMYTWWTSGPKLDFRANGDMKIFGPGISDDKTYVSMRVSNRGDRSSTVTKFGMAYYAGWAGRIRYLFRRKPDQAFFVSPITRIQIPYELSPGSIWDGEIIQNEQVEQMCSDGILIIELYHSHVDKPVRRRLFLKKASTEEVKNMEAA